MPTMSRIALCRVLAAVAGVCVALFVFQAPTAHARNPSATVRHYYSDAELTNQTGVERWNCAGGHTLTGSRDYYVTESSWSCSDGSIDHSLCTGHIDTCSDPDGDCTIIWEYCI